MARRHIALERIRFDGLLYEPGAEVPGLSGAQAAALLEAGALTAQAPPAEAPEAEPVRSGEDPALRAARLLAEAAPPELRSGDGWTSSGAPTVPALRAAMGSIGASDAAAALNARSRDRAWEAAAAGESGE